MKNILPVCAAAAIAACSTVQSRIDAHRDVFDASPPEVQRKIKDGQVDVGFTQEQAAMALGRPDRVYTSKTAQGEREVWVYGAGSGSATLGIGFGMGGPGFFGGESVAVGSGDQDARLRVVFEKGSVVSIDKRR